MAVDGGMSDNPRPALYGADYEAFLPARAADARPFVATVAGKHCEQGDVLVTDAHLPADVAVGDVLATPVTGAYGYSMASNYNLVPRPAVVFVRDGGPASSCGARRSTTSSPATDDGGDVRQRRLTRSSGDERVTGRDPRVRSRRRRAGAADPRPRRRHRGAGGCPLEVARVAVARPRQGARPAAAGRRCFTDDAAAVVGDPDVDIVVEVIGGIEPARHLIVEALMAGKPVVTANKELLATHGRELFETAEGAGVDILFEASVGGGIPLIRPLRESLAGDRIRRVMGIVNGTTNYILTRMTDAGASFADALGRGADASGFAETDPTADVEGFDAAAKVAIIASIAFGARVVAGDVYREGITELTDDDIASARDLGYVGEAARGGRGVRRRGRGARAPGDGAGAAPARRRCATRSTRCSSRATRSAS